MLMVVNEDTQGKKYYDHEFTTIKKIDGLPTVLRKSKTTEGGQNHQSLLSILAEDVWFNNASKVVDENGEPLVVYHGTNENFSIFEHDKIGESSGDYGYSGYGFYFTPNEGEAWMYGTIKMPVFLNIKNPFRCDFADLEKYSNILSFDENDKNNIIDKEKLISALESKSPVAKDFFQELEKNGYEKACENIMQKYSDEEIKQSPIDFNNVVEYWEYAQGKIEVPYYVAEDIIAELGEDIIKREYVETPHLKELLNYGKDWLSLDSIFLDAKELVNGQQSIGGYLKKIAQAPVNKIINGLNPILKMPIELATGRTMYPDAFNSRTIRDNEKYIAQSLGLAWPYKALVTGEPRNDWDDWDELSRMLIYSLDPDEAAYFQTLDKVRQFQERVLDKKFDSFATTRRGKVLQNLKRALRYKDKATIRRYLKEYAKVDGTKKGLQQSMKAMSPLFGLSKDEKKQFLKWITADDRKYLRRADKYFRELTSRFLR